MPLTAREVIHQARDAHPALDKQSTPDVVALRWLATHQQDLLAKIAHLKRDAVHAEQVIALPLGDFAAGEVLDEYLTIHGIRVTYTDANRDPIPLRLVEYPLRLERFHTPAGYIRAGTLLLLGDADDWTDVESLTVDYFPRGATSLAHATELVLPGQAMRACAGPLSVFMAGRVPAELGPVTVPDPSAAVEAYLDEVTERTRAKVSTIREVW